MIAYLSVEKNMLHFRTEDDSIDVYFYDSMKIEKIYKINSFNKYIINAEVKSTFLHDNEYNKIYSNTEKVNYDMQSILDLMGISVEALKKVTEVMIEDSDIKKNEYYFRNFTKDGFIYIEVTDKNKKHRSVHDAYTLNLIATTMPPNMVSEYTNALTDYYNSLSKTEDDQYY